MYYIKSTKRGYLIYYEDYFSKEKMRVSEELSQYQSEKWCNRLNSAYNMGYSDGKTD